MSKKKILFIIPCSLFPLESGGMQAIYNGIISIIDYYDVYITYPMNLTEQDKFELCQFNSLLQQKALIIPYIENCEINKNTFLSKLVNKSHRILDTIHETKKKPQNPFSYWTQELLPQTLNFYSFINGLIKEKSIDIVQCEMLCTLSSILNLPSNIKKIFVHHEIGFVRHSLELENFQNKNYNGLAAWECSKILEIGQLNKYDGIITLSSIDRKKLIDAGIIVPIHNSFAIVNESNQQVVTKHYHHQLSFVGPDFHEPNVSGILWFLNNCWSKLLKIDSQFQLNIIGKWSEWKIKNYSKEYPNISFKGYVNDLYSAIEGTIMIVPITIGSGIRMKILEASNIGIPFISTSIGAEGIPVENEKHCLIADNADDFVKAIIKMEKNESLRNSCVEHSKQLVKEKFSLEALKKNRLSIYSSLYEK